MISKPTTRSGCYLLSRSHPCIVLAWISLLTVPICLADSAQPAHEVPFTSQPPVLDGLLDDPVWQRAALSMGDWVSYWPLHGDKIEQQTFVWAAYDENYLYLAFRCTDPEPDKIRTTTTRRDRMYSDDWIGVAIDSLNSRRSSYSLYVNPTGIQGDSLLSAIGGEDPSPDWKWDSAASLGPEGYNVEIRIPFRILRFKGGKEVRMGVIFWRWVSRLGLAVSWPTLSPGKPIWEHQATLLFHNLREPLILEAIPALTYSRNQSRTEQQGFSAAQSRPDLGVTAKFGLTSAAVLDLALNPDFSQVESDAFQVEVNQRYPIFLSEKRPFFMEGIENFNLAGSTGGGNMSSAVHTRNIVDPSFALKLSGSAGDVAFTALTASDRAPGDFQEASGLAIASETRNFNVARAIYSFGQSHYVGAIVTDTRNHREYNRVGGGDFSLQFGHQQINATFLASKSAKPHDLNAKAGTAGQASYRFNDRRYFFVTQLEHYAEDFQMDSAFYRQTGFGRLYSSGSVSYYPDSDRFSWFKQIEPYVSLTYGVDRLAEGREIMGRLGVRMNFTRQGYLSFGLDRGSEPWAGREFSVGSHRFSGAAQLTSWLNITAGSVFSRSIFYDPVLPFSGNLTQHSVEISLQPNSRLNHTFSHTRVGFRKEAFNKAIYEVTVLHSATSWQLNRYFLLRAILQYDSSRSRVLADLLGSYELNPGTVLHVGYGSLLERKECRPEGSTRERGGYRSTERAFFMKASYLYSF